MKNPDTGEPGDEQEVDIHDVEVSSERVGSRLPPPLPPTASMAPSQPPAVPMYSTAPQPAGRSPMFYIGILVAVLVVSIAGGTAVALSRRRAAVVAAPATTAQSQQPKVINMPVVEVNDDVVDGGP